MSYKLNLFKNNFVRSGVACLAMSAVLVSCSSDDNTGTVNPVGPLGSVALQFKTIIPSLVATSALATNAPTQTNEILIQGTNGTLHLTDVHFIVDEVELENETLDDDFNEFESGLFFVDLPFDGSALELATSEIPAGTYTNFEFGIDDLDLSDGDDDDIAEQNAKEALLTTIREQFPDWPVGASLKVSGSFVTNDGVETPFTVYAEAEVEIEKQLNPALQITTDATTTPALTVNINPEDWFVNSDGSVMNLADYDYGTTQQLLEFDVEIEHGFTEVDVDDDAIEED